MNERQYLISRITEYLSNGGLFNPESMNHQEVMKLMMDVRDYLLSYPLMHIPTQPYVSTDTRKCPQCGITGVNGLVCPDHNCPSKITC